MARCKLCKARDATRFGLLAFCNIEHAIQYAQENKHVGETKRERALRSERRRLERADRIKHRAEKQKVKTLEQLCVEAQTNVNRFVRLRDRASYGRCIACDKPEITDAAHYHAVGSKYRVSRLRLNPEHIHGCCAKCNRFVGGGNREGYDMGIIVRYGEAKLEAIKQLQRNADSGLDEPLTREEVGEIKRYYAKMCRELEANA